MSSEKIPEPTAALAEKLSLQLEQCRSVQTDVITPNGLTALRGESAVATEVFALQYNEFMNDLNDELMHYLRETLACNQSTARALIENSALWHALIGSTFVPERCSPPATEADKAALGLAEMTVIGSLKNFLLESGHGELVEKYFTERA